MWYIPGGVKATVTNSDYDLKHDYQLQQCSEKAVYLMVLILVFVVAVFVNSEANGIWGQMILGCERDTVTDKHLVRSERGVYVNLLRTVRLVGENSVRGELSEIRR